MKRILIALTTIAAMAILLTSCAETDVKLSKNLVGTWDVNSWNVSGVEVLGIDTLGFGIDAMSYKFEDEGDGMGKVTQTLTVDFFGIPTPFGIVGTYQTVSGDVDQLILTMPDDSTTSTTTMTMELEDSDLRLEFTEDGQQNIITAVLR